MKILIMGDVFRPSSYANVNMHLCYYLRKMGIEAYIKPRWKLNGNIKTLCQQFMPHKKDAFEILGEALKPIIRYSKESFDYALYYFGDYPHEPKMSSLDAGKSIGYCVWGFNNLDQTFEQVAEDFDEIWSPAQHVIDKFIDLNWKPKDKTFALPHGYEPDVFYPAKDKPKNKKFTFCMCNAIADSKGANIAIRAFIEEFKKDSDKVELWIQTTAFNHRPNVKNNFGDYYGRLIDIQNTYPYQMPIYYVAADCNQSQMADLYKYTDCALHPHRVDCYGLMPMEIMASGTPIIVSRFNGPTEYIHANYPLFVEGDMSWMQQIKDGQPLGIFEPDFEDLKKKMRMSFNQFSGLHKAPQRYLSALTWEEVAKKMIARMSGTDNTINK